MNVPSTAAPSFGLLLRQVRDALMRQLDAEMKGELPDFGFSHYVGLKVLAVRSPCTANELALALDQTPSAVTRLLDKLEALGAVRREPHAQDRRALQIVMTEQGVALWERLRLRGERAIEHGLRDLSAPERELHLTSHPCPRCTQRMNAASSPTQTLRPRSMRLARPFVITALALALAACASSRGLTRRVACWIPAGCMRSAPWRSKPR